MGHRSRVGDLRKSRPLGKAALILCFLAATATYARASVALLMEEPYGKFGAMNPTGHAAVYFNHICAVVKGGSATQLLLCFATSNALP